MTDIQDPILKMNVHQRLALAMGEVDYIQKEAKKGMSYTIVSHDAVTAKVRPVLLRHRVVYYPVRCDHSHDGNRAECSMTVRFVNIDEPSDFFDVPTFGYGIDTQDKGPGKAMSYAVKYAILKALGLETGDDPDTESVEHVPAKKASKDDEARKIFTFLQNDFRAIKDTDQLKLWWKDVAEDRNLLPESWHHNLKDEWIKHGLSLKADPVDDIVKQTGGKIVNDTFVKDFIDGK